MRISAGIIVTLLLIGIACPDACGMTIGDFLATASNDYTLDHQNEKIDFLHTSSSNTPFLDRVEFRTETDGFEFPRQRYSLRFYPTGWGETATGEKVYETTVAYNEAERDVLFHQALKKRYTLVLDFLHVGKLSELTKALMVLQGDRVQVLRRMSDGVDFDVNDLIEAEDDHTRLQLELIDLESRKRTSEKGIRLLIPQDASVEFGATGIAEINLVDKTIERLDGSPAEDNVYLRNSRAQCELARWQYDLERSRGRKYLSFFETHYDNEERHDTREAIFVEFGIRFPFINANRLDTNRRMLTYLTEKGNYEELERALTERRAVLRGAIKRLLAQHDVLVAQKEKATSESALDTYRHLEGVDPLVLLKMQESILERDIALEKIRYEIYTTYIDLLDAGGNLSARPLRNYLSPAQEQLGP